jgi:hypothetical protein
MRVLAAVFVAVLGACAVTPEVSDQQPVNADLAQYAAVYASVDAPSEVRAKQEFGPTSDRLLSEFVQNVNLQGKAASVGPAPTGGKALEARLEITEFNYVDGAARVLVGILAGNAVLKVNMTLRDPASGKVVGEVAAGAASSAMQGIFAADTARQVEAIAKQLASKLGGPGTPGTTQAGVAPKTALAAPTAAVPPTKGLPAAGTLWKYRFQDRKFSGRNRDFSVQLAGTAGSSVTETFATGGNQQTYTSNSQAIDFQVRTIDSEPVYELAPYLLAHMPAPSAPPAHRPAYATSGTMAPDWQVRITELRREPVQVPAGRFESVRLRITGENPTGQHSTHSAHAVNAAANDYRTQRFEYTVWYVPEIGRYAQSRHQTFNRYGEEIGDEWVQLSSIERPR